MQFGFKADALVHFGTHGSLEFTPRKQVALSSNDWPDRLVGAVPHFYIYTIGNVGEGMTAKRRSYAGLQSYLTPPFMESSVRGIYRELMERIKIYNNMEGACSCGGEHDHAPAKKDTRNEADLRRASLAVKAATVKLGIHRELGLDSVMTVPYTEDDILRIENFAEELAMEKITGQLYTMGVPYEDIRITSSVYAMATDPIAYSLLALDKLRGRADEKTVKHRALFTQHYMNPARELVTRLLANPALASDELICRTAGVTPAELAKAREIEESRKSPGGMMEMMMSMKREAPAEAKVHADASEEKGEPTTASKGSHGRMPEGMKETAKAHGTMPQAMKEKMAAQGKDSASAHGKAMPAGMSGMMGGGMPKKKDYTKEEINFALAVMEVERTIRNVGHYKEALRESPEKELHSMINAMNGGYTRPSPGGDPIVNPNTLPTGRNLYGINAEATPSEAAWEKGIQMANNTIELYRRRHNDSIPRKAQ